MCDNNVEIYKQLYENIRWYMRLEWQLFKAALIIGFIVLTIRVTDEKHSPEWWQCVVSYICFYIFALLMMLVSRVRIYCSTRLKIIAKDLGDDEFAYLHMKSSPMSMIARILLVLLGFIIAIIGLSMPEDDAQDYGLMMMIASGFCFGYISYSVWEIVETYALKPKRQR